MKKKLEICSSCNHQNCKKCTKKSTRDSGQSDGIKRFNQNSSDNGKSDESNAKQLDGIKSVPYKNAFPRNRYEDIIRSKLKPSLKRKRGDKNSSDNCKQKDIEVRFNTAFYQTHAITPMHDPIFPSFEEESKTVTGGYIRSSNQGNIYNYRTAPLYSGIRNSKVIGSRPNNVTCCGLDFTHEGLSLTPAQQNDILREKWLGSKAKKNRSSQIAFQLVGDAYVKKRSTVTDKAQEQLFIQSSREILKGAKISSRGFTPQDTKKSKETLTDTKESKKSLTDTRLLHSIASCTRIAVGTRTLKYLKVFHLNKYPCLGVLFATPLGVQNLQQSKSDFTTENWMILMLCLLLGVSDHKYEKESDYQLKILYKTSFGHLETTVSDCGEVMRINVGYLTMTTEENLINLLTEFDQLLGKLFNNIEPKEINIGPKEINIEPKKINIKWVVETSINTNLFTRSENKKNSSHIARSIKKPEKFYIYASMMRECFEGDDPIGAVLAAFEQGQEQKEKQLVKKHYQYTPPLKSNSGYLTEIENLYGIKSNGNTDDVCYPQVISTVRKYVGATIYNKYIADKSELEEDGYGSNSEAEESYPESLSQRSDRSTSKMTQIYAQKIILPYGMRASAIAMYLAQCLDEKDLAFDTRKMYYETSKIEQQYYSFSKTSEQNSEKQKVTIVDANYFPNSYFDYKYANLYDNEKPSNTLINAKIIDITSSTSRSIAEIVYAKLIDNADDKDKYVILVSSLTKNEFGGFDTIGCGALRLFYRIDTNDDKIKINQILSQMKQLKLEKSTQKNVTEVIGTPTSGFINMMRRGYKEEYGMTQNKTILNEINELLKRVEG
ncbi:MULTISPECIES: hypothetical protein [Cysteiniphilum]|uniref:Uncharacterized protein n=1 Tax=Cysteiniphilum litorale TaxID=2056700 RepID=A0A8J3E7A3_9GAMM|nr:MULTISPECIES: hypothetical protein [Cysteiniphilum]GGF90879.1 hypothetical protein GCM10010995_05200 [Cysteiniphilum litorale]